MTDIKPGAFGLSVIEGKTGRLVRRGQDIVDGRKTKFTHAFLVLDNHEVIEAEPGGAQIVSLDKYLSRDPNTVLFSDKPVQTALATHCGPLNFEQLLRERIVDIARGLEGIPYNYLDYLAIGLEHFGIDLPIVRSRVRRQDRLICSQLCDFVYNFAGIHLFDDGRLPQDVTPGDLEGYVLGIV